jgi:two-component system cell cycle sensor histidine kinase/response regulator CckA
VAQPILTRVRSFRRPRRPICALLVEDDADVRATAEGLLLAAGCDLVLVANPERAVELAEDGEPFDVLVTDVVMPGTSGVQLARRLRSYRPDLPVVFVSGYPPEQFLGALSLYRSEFVEKPLSRDELASALDGVLRRS